ncbi:flagellar protein [Paenibacillus sp. SYP-B3998]|uniref:Flagellar protein n=1 Tax=Paenibacillus sp. SYP-B3998 TaxID=2678564 RepID=A0A6G3ZWS0_9BACL|nr:flagellar protein [Paenibacillus sp. SYP-B3998]NEW06154.1 flagellar protein [Paenibacillus sp. SYP-B3998]
MTIPHLIVANCPRCGKVFQKNLRNQCSDCSHGLDSMLNRVLEFLRKNHRSSCEQVQAATGVTLDQMYGWMKEGKLFLSDYPNLHYRCASCSSPIRNHKLCADCTYRLNKDIRALKEKEPQFGLIRREKVLSVAGGFQIRERFSGV